MGIYRKIIDGFVIILTLFIFGPYLFNLFPSSYTEILPDEIVALDESIEAHFETAKGGFETLLANPTPLENYSFSKIIEKMTLSSEKIYEKNVDGIVYINSIGTDGFWYTGSGTLITKDGLVLTNYHVISDSEIVLVTTTDGNTYEVESVVAYDPILDVAFLKIDADGLSSLTLGDSDDLHIGETVYSIGHAEGFLNTFSNGIISGLRDYSSTGEGTQIQTTNPTSQGNSGGALLNQYGELIGIPSSLLEYDYNIVQVQNINFAIPINSALELLKAR